MPLYKTITIDPETTIYIWKVEESFEELCSEVVITSECTSRVHQMKSQVHRKGFMSIRQLLAVAGYTDEDLVYDENGKPHLKDHKFISITHSFHFTGIIVSTKEVGLDIEMQREKILRIAHKFTPIQEYRTLANAEAVIRKLTIVWGAKEAIYKLYSQKGLGFLQHINITDFDFDDGHTTGRVIFKNQRSDYKIGFYEFEGFTCVYALEA